MSLFFSSRKCRYALRAVIAIITIITVLVPPSLHAAWRSEIERAFWAREWGSLEKAYQAGSDDIIPWTADDAAPMGALTTKDLSLYVNGLWRQSRYAEGVSILDSVSRDFPAELRPYASMLLVLGMERTDRKDEALELGRALWEEAPVQIRYYLAYALGRLTSDMDVPGESLSWFRKMLELAPDRKRRLPALNRMIDLPGVSGEEAAILLIDLPSNARALEICRAMPKGAGSAAEYALGYNDYVNKRYSDARSHFGLVSADAVHGEAARYYNAYSAYREKKDDTAYKLWADVALTGFDYPQRSVQRLVALAARSKKADIISLLGRVADKRAADYPELAADALVGIIKLSDGRVAANAEKKLFERHRDSNQAATTRWDMGWSAWKSGKYKLAYDEWNAGYSQKIPSGELASRLLFWQVKALERLNSPMAAQRAAKKLVDNHPGEYHTFLVSPDGGISTAPLPASYDMKSPLEEWGFVTYARLDPAIEPESVRASQPNQPGQHNQNIQAAYRAVRLALWEGDYATGARIFDAARKLMTSADLSSAELLRCSYPMAFKSDVMAASEKTGLDPSIIWGIMRQESMYEPDVTSSVGAYGLMQLMPATARGEAQKLKMDGDAFKQSANNILLGANHMIGLMARFKDLQRSLAAYNAGGTPVARWSAEPIKDMAEWVEDIGYRETRGYVKAVLRNINVYKSIYQLK
ncbi:MAG: lytic transglycosylase domain-containing protein [Synergistaceae bacterium]|jgi:soluble lytic murein transglycosylase|nr:lytic transglycosylase domain-containing protein [Synergistaceae bacterium]